MKKAARLGLVDDINRSLSQRDQNSQSASYYRGFALRQDDPFWNWDIKMRRKILVSQPNVVPLVGLHELLNSLSPLTSDCIVAKYDASGSASSCTGTLHSPPVPNVSTLRSLPGPVTGHGHSPIELLYNGSTTSGTGERNCVCQFRLHLVHPWNHVPQRPYLFDPEPSFLIVHAASERKPSVPEPHDHISKNGI